MYALRVYCAGVPLSMKGLKENVDLRVILVIEITPVHDNLTAGVRFEAASRFLRTRVCIRAASHQLARDSVKTHLRR